MIFSAPIFIYLLPSAGLPILFHFFLKQKKRQLLFPSLMFFYKTDPRLNSRRKIHQLLLLLMRALLIAFILLALSRPRFQSSLPVGGRISVVAVVDNSGSMGDIASGDKTKLELAVEGAKKLISTLGESAKMNVVTLVEDSAITFGNSLTTDRESLLSSLGKITPTNATGNVQLALEKSFELLGADSVPGGVVHVFSDLQESDWADEALQSISVDGSINIVLHRIESTNRQQANAVISSVQLPTQKILPKQPLKISIVCRNNSKATANIRVNSIDNQGNKNTQQVVLQPGRNQTVEVGLKPDAPGCHWLRTWIEGDGFFADNEAGIGVFCEKTAVVLFCGQTEEFGVLPTAFSPDNYGQFTGMISKLGRIDQIPQVDDQQPILIVTTWEEIRQMNSNSFQLRQYVENGGNLLVVPSSKRISARGKIPTWLDTDTNTRMSHPRGIKMEVLEKKSDFWNRILEATGTISLENANVFISYPLSLSEGFIPLLGTDPNRVIFAYKQLGKGNIYVSGTAFDPRWNTLPLSGLIVVLAQSIAVGGTSFEEESTLSLIAGEHPKGIDTGGRQVEVLSLVGDAIDWRGQANEMPAFSKAGVYLIKSDDKEYCVSVRSSEKEGLEQFLKGSQVPAMEKITHKIVNYNPNEELQKYHAGQSRTFEMFLPLLLLATLALLVEGWLANPVRARREETKKPENKRKAPQRKRVNDKLNEPDHEFLISRGAE